MICYRLELLFFILSKVWIIFRIPCHLTVLKLRILYTLNTSKVRLREVFLTKKKKKISKTPLILSWIYIFLIVIFLGWKEPADDNKCVAQTGKCKAKDCISHLSYFCSFLFIKAPIWKRIISENTLGSLGRYVVILGLLFLFYFPRVR